MTERVRHHVVFERDDNGRWFVHCPGLVGAHSHGRTLASARSNVREAIALVLDVADDSGFDLVEDIRLNDPTLQGSVEHARSLRDRANGLEQQARSATLEAIKVSTGSDASLGMRDLADLLGLSHQRIQQISATTSER
jgi:predicted RNase H-like HicB family nuclease